MRRSASDRTRIRLLRATVALCIASAPLVGGAAVAHAQAPGEGSLEHQVIVQPDRPVTNAPLRLFLGVTNTGDTTASGITIEATLPPEAIVTSTPESSTCSEAGTTITCELASVGPNTNAGFFYFLEFGTEGTFPLSSTATSLTPASVASEVVDIEVGPEDADLQGFDETAESLTDETQRVFHAFRDLGPTAAGGASISGVIPADIEVVPGSFFFGTTSNLADERCTVSTTSFTCTPVASGVDGFTEAVRYDAVMPSEAATIEAEATITGRNDPDPTNDASTVTINVREPAAELVADLIAPSGVVFGGQPVLVTGRVQNIGELPAEDLILSMTAPADWTATVQAAEPAPSASCTVQSSGHDVLCTLPTLGSFGLPLTVDALLTPPAGATGTGDVTIDVTSATPEAGTLPNTATAEISYQPFVPMSVTVTPSTDLSDGQTVRVDAAGFLTTQLSGALMCQAGATSTSQCDFSTVQPFLFAPDGTVSIDYDVTRVILTPEGGRVDCAVDGCQVTVGTADQAHSASAPVSFTNTPLPTPFQLELIDPHHLEGIGPATIRARLHCDADLADLRLTFELAQPTPTPVTGESDVVVDCQAGQTLVVPSDLMAGFATGPAIASVSITERVGEASHSDQITIRSFEDAVAELLAAIEDPNDPTTVQTLFEAIRFRLDHNPIFRREFFRAIFR